MISATYFGEITELGSRAVWYSDEEDDDEDDEDRGPRQEPKLLEPLSHESLRSNISLNFSRLAANSQMKIVTCVISIESSAKFKSHKLSDEPALGFFDTVGKVFAYPLETKGHQHDHLLWLLFDAAHPMLTGHKVGYFVEALRGKLESEFNLDHANQIIILSQQFSSGDHLEYLSNFDIGAAATKLPFVGKPIGPPSLIRNQFESALFEQLTLSLQPAILACLPDPRDFLFDRRIIWPTIPERAIELRVNDDNLDKTLIFM